MTSKSFAQYLEEAAKAANPNATVTKPGFGSRTYKIEGLNQNQRELLIVAMKEEFRGKFESQFYCDAFLITYRHITYGAY